jgi:ketosteroid isomerase-like protein
MAKSDALRERYERFSQGDLERALDLWTDDFV